MRMGLRILVVSIVAACGPPPMTCVVTGGTWTDCGSGCGPTTCDNRPTAGQACPAVCRHLCECPADRPVWNPVLGCVDEAICR